MDGHTVLYVIISVQLVEMSTLVVAPELLAYQIIREYLGVAKFTAEQIEIATRVMSESKLLTTWVRHVAKAYNVDITTDVGKVWAKKKAREQAKRLIK